MNRYPVEHFYVESYVLGEGYLLPSGLRLVRCLITVKQGPVLTQRTKRQGSL